jgi:hypothetical protein
MSETIHLGLTNDRLYAGCQVEEVAGRLNLTTPVAEAVAIVGRNAEAMVADLVSDGVDEVELTGPMAVWAYLIVFHAVVHRVKEVRYNDGRSGAVVVARHG